jgi:hypothetical protein
MITPGTFDFTIYRGTTDPFLFRISNDDGTIPFTDIQLTISLKTDNEGAAPIVRKKLTDDDPNFDVDDYSGIVTWIPTPAESRAIPVGDKAKYEVELRNGTSQLIYLIGEITALGGINADV